MNSSHEFVHDRLVLDTGILQSQLVTGDFSFLLEYRNISVGIDPVKTSGMITSGTRYFPEGCYRQSRRLLRITLWTPLGTPYARQYLVSRTEIGSCIKECHIATERLPVICHKLPNFDKRSIVWNEPRILRENPLTSTRSGLHLRLVLAAQKESLDENWLN